LRQQKNAEAHQDFKKALELEPGLKAKLEPLMAAAEKAPAPR
jgi:hypothetical protein